jgi:hypothetical protein
MKFSQLDEILQLKLKKVCRQNKELKGWLPSSNDYVIIYNDAVDSILSKNLEIIFENNRIVKISKIKI